MEFSVDGRCEPADLEQEIQRLQRRVQELEQECRVLRGKNADLEQVILYVEETLCASAGAWEYGYPFAVSSPGNPACHDAGGRAAEKAGNPWGGGQAVLDRLVH